jgi:tetratricopeptide (TPR) repeat protein
MSQPTLPPIRAWFHYLIVIALAGFAGSGVALFIINHETSRKVAPTNIANSKINPTANLFKGTLDSGKNSPPSTPPSINDEPPPMLAGNMPSPQAALALGNWYFDHQNWQKAIDKYETAVGLGIDNADVRTDLGSAYRFSGNAQMALKEYQRAQIMDPKHENSLFNQGAIYVLMLKQPQKGVTVWKEYIKKFPHGESVNNAKKLIEDTQTEFKMNK